jgi:4-amino-4-deoxy-L-arabinose transferase-like glycosyltransferase
MKALPMQFKARQYWSYPPERIIAVFNQALFFAAILLLFRLARRQFDDRVAWLSALLFGGTSLFWRFSVSGLSTMFVIVVLLAMVSCLVRIAEGTEMEPAPVKWSALAGVLVAIGGLGRYAIGWMIVPVILFLASGPRGSRGKYCAAALTCFLIVFGPWLIRNTSLTATPFGTASYAIFEETPMLEKDTLERSLNQTPEIRRVEVMDVFNKLFENSRELLRTDLPKFGGNWLSAFFLVGLLIPFQSAARSRIRWFLVGSIVLLFIVQALGKTHLTDDSPEINSENILAILAPLTFVYGAALFYTLLDQLNISMETSGAITGIFLTVLSAPLLISFLVGVSPALNTPYSPLHIQKVAQLMGGDELMMSDIPAAVAWYGDRDCSWLTLDDSRDFLNINVLRPIHAVFLTQRTSDGRLLSQMSQSRNSWGQLYLQCEAHLEVEGHGEVPSGFPLRQAPSGFLPDQLLLSDRVRWGAVQPREK